MPLRLVRRQVVEALARHSDVLAQQRAEELLRQLDHHGLQVLMRDLAPVAGPEPHGEAVLVALEPLQATLLLDVAMGTARREKWGAKEWRAFSDATQRLGAVLFTAAEQQPAAQDGERRQAARTG